MTERLSEIRGRLDAISKGRWHVDVEIDGVYADRKTVVRRERLPEELVWAPTRIVSVGQTRRHDRNAENNVEFIANAPEDMEFLLAEVYRLQRELNMAKAGISTRPGARFGW